MRKDTFKALQALSDQLQESHSEIADAIDAILYGKDDCSDKIFRHTKFQLTEEILYKLSQSEHLYHDSLSGQFETDTETLDGNYEWFNN